MKTGTRKHRRTGSLVVLTVALFATVLLATGCHSPGYAHYYYPAYHGHGYGYGWCH
jgi:hypothetical protein